MRGPDNDDRKDRDDDDDRLPTGPTTTVDRQRQGPLTTTGDYEATGDCARTLTRNNVQCLRKLTRPLLRLLIPVSDQFPEREGYCKRQGNRAGCTRGPGVWMCRRRSTCCPDLLLSWSSCATNMKTQ